MILLLPLPPHSSPLNRRHTQEFLEKETTFLTGERVGGGAKSYDRKEDWSSINYRIISGMHYRTEHVTTWQQ
jgi:hypothetical protein